VVKTRGSEDAIHLGPRVWITVAVSMTVLTLLHYGAYRFFLG
jgi:hypothetical protein